MRLNIDISAGVCTGRCSHCSHGLARPRDEVVSFPDDLVAMYRRLEV